MSEKEELLPCPFCGGKAEIRKVGQHPYDYIPTCTKGGCYADISCRDTYEEAVTAWNTRPQPDNPDNEAEGVLALFDTCRDSRETNGWANYSFLPEHIESIRRALNQFAERRNMVPDLEEIKRDMAEHEAAQYDSDELAMTAHDVAESVTERLAARGYLGQRWKTIDTAPKDGKSVLVLYKPYKKLTQAIAYFMPKYHEEASGDMYDEGWFEEDHKGNLFWPEGWYTYSNADDEIHLKIKPTHWMPLPPPPQTEMEG